jgi:hypothetical protein
MPATRSKTYAQTADEYKTVAKVVPVEFFLAAGIVDGEGKKSNRVLFRPVGTKKFYFLFAQGTEENMRTAAPWLQEAMERELGVRLTSMPDDTAADLPTGSPV